MLATLFCSLLLAFGPPWISIELPPSPYDASTRDAFLLVHTFHHGEPRGYPVTGVAEGLVDGKRQRIALALQETSRTGVYALRKQWGDAGAWTLVITATQAKDDIVQAVVEVRDGVVRRVTVPLSQELVDGRFRVPRTVTPQEIEASLAGRAP